MSETVARHRETFRRNWGDPVAYEIEPWPEPRVRARTATRDETPSPAKKLADAAEATGWETRVVYSRGTSQVGRVDHPERGPVADAISVRCRRGAERVVGYWRQPVPRIPFKYRWAWAFGLAQGEYAPRLVGARECLAMVAEPPSDAL